MRIDVAGTVSAEDTVIVIFLINLIKVQFQTKLSCMSEKLMKSLPSLY